MANNKNNRKNKKKKSSNELAKKLSNQDKYNLHQDFTSELISGIRSHFPSLQGIRSRGANPLHEYAKVYSSRKGPLEDNEGIINMLGYENLLYKDNVPTVFPQSVNLIEQLCKAKFSAPDKMIITPPFKNFTIAMPKGLKVAGVDMPGIAVFTGNRHDIYDVNLATALATIYADDTVENLLEDSLYEKDDPEQCVIIKFKSPVTNTHIHERMNMELFHLLLKSKDLKEFNKLKDKYLKDTNQEVNNVKKVTVSQNESQINKNDIIMYSAFKMYATLCVYLSCSKNAKMVDGLPGPFTKQAKRNESLLRSADNFFVESTPEIEALKEIREEGSAHYRGMFFRNLQHAKYYQGEHKEMERGSRWTEVSGCFVGLKATPSTIIDKDNDELSM